MKRLIALLTVLVLLPVLSAFAEGTPAEDYVFSLRNGIRWGMTPEEFKATEWADQELYYSDYDESLKTAGYSLSDVSVSNFTADFSTFFIDGRLVCMVYSFDAFAEEDFSYLRNALAYRYGAFVPDQTQHFARLIHTTNEGSAAKGAPDESLSACLSYEHLLPDGTSVILAAEPDYDEVYLFYCNEAILNEAFGIYNTFGL